MLDTLSYNIWVTGKERKGTVFI